MAEQDKDSEQKKTSPDAETKSKADPKKQDKSAKVEASKPRASSTPMKISASKAAEPEKKPAEPEKKPAEPEKQHSRPAAEQTKPASKEPTPAPQPKPAAQTAATAPEKKSGRGPVWLALLLALMAGGGAGYTYWLFSQYTVTAKSATSEIEERTLKAIESQSKAISSDLERQNQKFNAQNKLVQEFEDRLGATLRQVNEISHVSRRSWMLAEAEYLLRLANQRLIMEREITSPLALLKAADEILLIVDDVNLYPVRAELAKEIEALRAIGRMDVEGVFLRLNALEQQVASLELLSPESEAVEIASEAFKVDSDVVGTMKKAWSRLLDQVRIRHRNEPVEPLLSPEQHQYIQQNLRLMLEQAQLALLQQRTGIYRQSLEKAEGWVKSYFQLNQSTDSLLASLKELKEINISPKLPDISPSLALLKQYLTNPDILLEQKTSAEKSAGQANMQAPASGGS